MPIIIKHWYEKTGLIIALAVGFFSTLAFLIPMQAKSTIALTILIIIELLIFVIWYLSRRPPKTKKDKVGFLISIACDNDKESKKLRDDFIIPLRQQLKTGQTGSGFHFMTLKQHHAKRVIEEDEAEKIRQYTKPHFMLYGRVRLRTIDNKEQHIIDLNGLVTHRPVSSMISQVIAKEFAELLPRQLNIPTQNDLLSLQFTSEWIAVVTKYIIGIAAAYSGDLDYAEQMYRDALLRLKNKDPKIPIYKSLNSRLPIRISELYETRANIAHRNWVLDNDPKYINEIGENLASIDETRKKTQTSVLHLEAIYLFLKDRDIDGAIKIILKIKHMESALWCYNIAFLEAYRGNLKLAIRYYRKASSREIEASVITQVEDFLCWIIKEEPDKYHLYYCLGFFNWKTKGDNLRAIKDFENFLNSCKPNEYEIEKNLTNKWLEEINST